MTFDLHRTLESKRALRQRLASRPISEKLRLLDALRERELAIRGRSIRGEFTFTILREEPEPSRNKPECANLETAAPNGAKETSSDQGA